MRRYDSSLVVLALLVTARSALAAEPQSGESPADHLPPYITQLTAFGERPDWSPDGKRILFLSKTYGDVLEIDVATRAIHNLTAHFPHAGFTRALYLANGDILLSGPETLSIRSIRPKPASIAFFRCSIRALTKPPTPLGIRCNEGPAVSRHKSAHRLDRVARSADERCFAEGVARSTRPTLSMKAARQSSRINNRSSASSDLPFECTMETQNFRPPD